MLSLNETSIIFLDTEGGCRPYNFNLKNPSLGLGFVMLKLMEKWAFNI